MSTEKKSERHHEWIEQRKKFETFRQTPIGAAFLAFENAHGSAWVTDSQEHVSDRRLKEVWTKSNEARAALLALIEPIALTQDSASRLRGGEE